MTATRKSRKSKPKTRANEFEKHPVRAALSDMLEEIDESVLIADGFEDALIGLSSSNPGRPPLAVYDYDKCVDILMRDSSMSYEDAVEFLEFNTIGAWVGDGTPVFMRTTENILGEIPVVKKVPKKKRK